MLGKATLLGPRWKRTTGRVLKPLRSVSKAWAHGWAYCVYVARHGAVGATHFFQFGVEDVGTSKLAERWVKEHVGGRSH